MKLFKQFSLSNLSLTVRFLTVSDAVLSVGLGLFGPIFAIYITQQIETENILGVIGIGTSIYLFMRSIGQMPLAIIIDKIKGEKDDFYVLLTGSIIFIIVPILYIFISEVWHLFAIQFIYGLGAALVSPTWLAIFTRHIDKGKEGLEWGIYQTTVDMSGAIAAPIGGFIASLYGFTAVMISASIIATISSIFIFAIRDDLRLKNKPNK
ncbi:MAG: MFS transporter [Candidatus Pacebacteria bacterium]|nr:MFS transporter [Candidatus Paceibacterota bacterium]MCF7857245.1 MFS transporter [Candidatus Paceibacterota bacterium]